MNYLLVFVIILSLFGILASILHKGPDERNSRERYRQTAELTRQMREQNKDVRK